MVQKAQRGLKGLNIENEENGRKKQTKKKNKNKKNKTEKNSVQDHEPKLFLHKICSFSQTSTVQNCIYE